MINPFTIKVISDPEFFCNRIKELDDLISFARSQTNVVLYSPRRYGKTSLVRQVQKRLETEHGALISYVDFFAVSSIDDVAQRIARSIYQMLQFNENLFKRSIKILKTFKPIFQPSEDGSSFSLTVQPSSPGIVGIDLLEKTLEDLGNFLKVTNKPVQITFDEFQEITELREPRIEGILRTHIQMHPASYFFVGSRRRILLDMFVDRKRPFYQSAINYELKCLPGDEFAAFIKAGFKNAGKKCPDNILQDILKRSCKHPYYTQKLAFFVFECSGPLVCERDMNEAFDTFINSESFVFKSMLQGLAPQQIALLKALAREPSNSIMSNRYMNSHHLKSVGGVQAAIKRLTQLDLIEKDREKTWQIVDPILSYWLLTNY
ncbi:MAG: ATP-binding protein [Desulfobacterium sp.]|jgi:hypothetical protein|nr:ATP-binding protein [Desulfobacterium sp.]